MQTKKESHSKAPRAACPAPETLGLCLGPRLTHLDTYPVSVLGAPMRCSIRVKVVPTAKNKRWRVSSEIAAHRAGDPSSYFNYICFIHSFIHSFIHPFIHSLNKHTQSVPGFRLRTLRRIEPWLVWLSGLSNILQTKRSLVRFLARAQPGLRARSLVGDMREATNQCISCTLMFLSLSFCPSSPLKIKK